MADTRGTPPLHPRLDELLRLDRDARLKLIQEISAKGFEPGCWIRLEDADLMHGAIAVRDMVWALERIEKLPAGALLGVEEFEGEHPWNPPADGESAWIIISQTCDLVRDVRDEPLIQVALLRCAGDTEDLPSWSRNSARWIPLDPTGKRSRYYVDLRVQAFVPKQLLAGQEVKQAIPADRFGKQRPRTRFPLRVGQRHSRIGVPTPIVERIVDPLAGVLKRNKSLRVKLDGAFSEWLLLPAEAEHDPLILLGITPHDPGDLAFRDAEDLFFGQLWNVFPPDLRERLDESRSQVIALDDLTVPVWTAAWRLDLDFLTYGSKGDADSPEPHA
ncbi:MAG TPA: hypothetical protein VLJ42_10235 [Solirubrobacteraceae bacterium]|nr:hypothetical protein [Solirubrobacteraceae bacterium]